MCSSGVGLTPVIGGKVHTFSVGGLHNGLSVLMDDESGTYWDHVSGEALKGPLLGHTLDPWPIRITTRAAALAERPRLRIALSDYRSPLAWIMSLVHRRTIHNRGFIPLPFYLTMRDPVDDRLPKLTQGLGVMVGSDARFYPMAAIPEGGIADDWHGRKLVVERGRIDGVPRARWGDGGEEPMQLLTRWYGFAYTYPNVAIYSSDA